MIHSLVGFACTVQPSANIENVLGSVLDYGVKIAHLYPALLAQVRTAGDEPLWMC